MGLAFCGPFPPNRHSGALLFGGFVTAMLHLVALGGLNLSLLDPPLPEATSINGSFIPPF